MQRLLFFIILLLSCSAVKSQPYIDAMGVSWQHSPDAALYGKDNNHLSTNNITGSLNFPVKLFKKDVLLISPLFEWNGINSREKGFRDFDLYGAMLGLSYIKTWKNEKWKTVFVSVNRISSGLKNVTIRHYQPGAAVLMIYERSSRVKYKLGAYYNSEFFGAFVLPLIGMDWKINDRLMLYGILPRGVVLEYKMSKHFYAGINWKAITNTYRYNGGMLSDYFKLEESQVRLFADIYFTKNIVLNLEAGHSLLRDYLRRSESQRLAGIDSDLDPNEGLLFKAGLYYRVRLDEIK